MTVQHSEEVDFVVCRAHQFLLFFGFLLFIWFLRFVVLVVNNHLLHWQKILLLDIILVIIVCRFDITNDITLRRHRVLGALWVVLSAVWHLLFDTPRYWFHYWSIVREGHNTLVIGIGWLVKTEVALGFFNLFVEIWHNLWFKHFVTFGCQRSYVILFLPILRGENFFLICWPKFYNFPSSVAIVTRIWPLVILYSLLSPNGTPGALTVHWHFQCLLGVFVVSLRWLRA